MLRSQTVDYLAKLAEAVEAIGANVVAKMTPTDVVITIIGVALIVAGASAFTNWLKNRTEQKKAELESADKRAWLDMHKEQIKHDTDRYELLVKAISRQPVLGDVEAIADASRQQMVRAIGDEGGGTMQGVPLQPDFVSEIVSQRRQYGTPIKFSGVYRVDRVDTTVPDGFRVTLTDTASGKEVSASLQDAIVSEDHKALLRRAEWSKSKIKVQLSAKLLRNRFVDAVILSVEGAEVAAELADDDSIGDC